LPELAETERAAEDRTTALAVRNLTHRYGERVAVDSLSFEVAPGTITAVLGPNGSGKTTLFRVLSTLARAQEGEVEIEGKSLARDLENARDALGVVFQYPSLDKKLTVIENLRHQAALYGMKKTVATERIEAATEAFGLTDRLKQTVETLSGGLQRRVELAKSLLHHPRILLLDEPSTGLDPGARADLRETLARLRREQGATILLTTHLIDEADFADRVLIMHQGKLVADGTPQALRAEVGGDVLTISSGDAEVLKRRLSQEWGLETQPSGADLRLQAEDPSDAMTKLLPLIGQEIHEITIGRPTLEDVFFARTGRLLEEESEENEPPKGKGKKHG